jgi:sugar/nucleoside kinase (ribokinase family)
VDELRRRRRDLVVVNLNTASLGDRAFTPDLLIRHLRAADLLMMNGSEERDVLRCASMPDWPTAARRLDLRRLKHIVVTLGKQGHRLADAPFDAWHHAPAHPSEVQCTLGAGDTFAGVLMAELLSTGDVWRASLLAAEAAASKISMFRSSL